MNSTTLLDNLLGDKKRGRPKKEKPERRVPIYVSEEVRAYLKENGEFGETVEDVLRRLLGIKGEREGRADAS